MNSKRDLEQLAAALERRTGRLFLVSHKEGRWCVESGGLWFADKTKRGVRCYLEGALAILGGRNE